MSTVKETAAAYRTSWGYLGPFTVIHLALRLLAGAVIIPLSSLALAAALAATGETALTDQDIALFLLTPAGLTGMLALVALSIIAAVLDLAVMTNTLRREDHAPLPALISGLSLVFARFTALFSFAVRLTLRVLLLAVPFLLAAALVAWVFLGDYDINYYLTHKPPEFLNAAAIIGALVVGLLLVLVSRLAGWAVALHFLLFQKVAPRDSFTRSSVGLGTAHRAIVAQVLVWALVRILLAVIIAAAAGLLVAGAQELFDANLRLVALTTSVVLLAWWLADAVNAAFANGALAALLDRHYRRVSGDDQDPVELDAAAPTRARMISLPLLLALAAVAVGAGTLFSDRLLDGVGAQRQVEIIAHRGAAAVRPENTMAAVTKALDDHADWVEIDVQETADGEVIVAHDSDFMKQAGVDLKVWNATATDLPAIDIGSWFDPAYASERPPTLRDVLLAAKDRGKVLIELKYYGHDVELEKRVAQMVDETGMADQVGAMSLKRPGVEKMRQLRPEWPNGILAATAIGDLSALDADFLALNTGQISLPLIRRAHAQGKKVYAWTVDDPVTMVRLISMGVDGLITNDPALARTVMQTRNDLGTTERLMLWFSGQFSLDRFELSADAGDA